MNPEFDTFVKLPFGGLDRRKLVKDLAELGSKVAHEKLAADRALIKPTGLSLPEGTTVLLLGGSGGILRSVALQLLFGERIPVVAVHYDSEKLQIGGHHARAITAAAQEFGVSATFYNADATRPETIAKVVEELKSSAKQVHLVNGIAAGATKRFEKYGKCKVRDLDVAFHPILQTVDFSSPDNFRKFGLVDVETASEADIERTYKFMGYSTQPWVEALANAGLLKEKESSVSFADYDFEKDDPVYGMGPLAEAKVLQRQAMSEIAEKYGVRTFALAYPAMNTTALSAIPGGVIMYALTAQILVENGKYQSLSELARQSMQAFAPNFTEGSLALDQEFQKALPEFHRRKLLLTPENCLSHLSSVFGNQDL
jgi:enoyl-[acyl-carrier protein] reductase / trans-2-enoyl-CoA reductase (NAD+)